MAPSARLRFRLHHRHLVLQALSCVLTTERARLRGIPWRGHDRSDDDTSDVMVNDLPVGGICRGDRSCLTANAVAPPQLRLAKAFQ